MAHIHCPNCRTGELVIGYAELAECTECDYVTSGNYAVTLMYSQR